VGRLRTHDLRGAFEAYREADRRAPERDKAEIANRLGWLSKELGNTGASGKYFARARGDLGLSFAVVVLAVSSVVSLTVELTGQIGQEILSYLLLDKVLVADGEVWRLWTVTLVHGGLLHLAFNMYALWIAGPFVEQLYGRVRFLAFSLVFAAGGSLASFVFSDARFAVGASGAIFGLFGLLVAVQYVHKPVVSRNARQFLSQMGGLIAINLVFGFVVPGIDNMAHIGGLLSGLWIGFLFAPARVQTMRSMWMRPGPSGTLLPAFGVGGTRIIRAAGVLALFGAFAVLYALGAGSWG
jgi:membrane associated rhomboid family serine protease